MSTLRVAMLALGVVGLLVIAGLRLRSRRLRTLDLLIGYSLTSALVVLAAFPNALNGFLSFFTFQAQGGQRLIGLLLFSNIALYFLLYYTLVRSSANEQLVDRLVRELAKRDFRKEYPHHEYPIQVVIPAYNESENIGAVLERIPPEIDGHQTLSMVVIDGATDDTEQVVRALDQSAISYTINRGGGSAIKAGYEMAIERGARIVVTLDADGQHQPEEMASLVKPILDDQADLVNGSRVLGTYEKDSRVRAWGVVFFNALISFLMGQKITDSSNAFRAIRADKLALLDLRQTQFHSSELLIDAMKKGLRVMEVPITITRRHSGESKKPRSLRYGFGFARAILLTWLR